MPFVCKPDRCAGTSPDRAMLPSAARTVDDPHGLDVSSLRFSNGHQWSVEVWHANVRFRSRQPRRHASLCLLGAIFFDRKPPMPFVTIRERRIEYRAILGTPARARPWCSCTRVWARSGFGAIFPTKLHGAWVRRPWSTHVSVMVNPTDHRASARRPSCTRRRSKFAALLDQLDIERPLLIGHSDGASIALIHAAASERPVAGLCAWRRTCSSSQSASTASPRSARPISRRPEAASRQLPRACGRRVPRLGRHLARAGVSTRGRSRN